MLQRDQGAGPPEREQAEVILEGRLVELIDDVVKVHGAPLLLRGP